MPEHSVAGAAATLNEPRAITISSSGADDYGAPAENAWAGQAPQPPLLDSQVEGHVARPLARREGIDSRADSGDTAGSSPAATRNREPFPLPQERRQGLVLEWNVPSSLNRGEQATLRVVARNAGSDPAVGVLVHVQLPEGAKFISSQPPAAPQDDVLSWRLGELAPGQSAPIELTLVPTTAGNLMPAAAITSTRLRAAKVEVLDPQLEISIEGAEQIALGTSETFAVRITNVGTGAAQGIVLSTEMAPPLAYGGQPKRQYAIGTLLPGHSRVVRLPAMGQAPGEAVLRATVSGRGNLGAETSHVVTIVEPKLEVAIQGPRLRYVERPAVYTVVVHNPGPAPAENVQVFDRVPAGFQFLKASPGGAYDANARQVAWFVGHLEPGHSAEVDVELLPVAMGDHQIVATALGDATAPAEAEVPTRVEGFANLVMDVRGNDDAIELGSATSYEIVVRNSGSAEARNVQVTAHVSDALRIRDARGPGRPDVQAQQVVFGDIATLPAGGQVTLQVDVEAVRPGRGRMRAMVRSSEITEPLMEEESTRVYADEP